MQQTHDGYRMMAVELLYMSLEDIRKVKSREAALAWFNDRSTLVFGYGWVLSQVSINPNLVRKAIDFMLKNPGSTWAGFQKTLNIKPIMRKASTTYTHYIGKI